jgi:uncharacterized protein (UPF0212 family)
MQPKVETNNIVKTVNNKYKAYASVLQMLSSDQYYSIPSFIKEVTGDMTSDLVSFAIPETTCPKCGKKVAEQKMTAMEALFTRHHLQTILVI